MIRVVVWPVDGPARITSITNDLATLQKLVGGSIEFVRVGDDGVVIIVNEDGISLGLHPSGVCILDGTPLLGDIVLAREDGNGELVSLTDADVTQLASLVIAAGGAVTSDHAN